MTRKRFIKLCMVRIGLSRNVANIIARSRIPEHQRSYGERNEDENGRT